MEALFEQSGYEGKTNIEHLTHASKDGTDELNFKPLLHKVTFTEKNIVIPILVLITSLLFILVLQLYVKLT